MVRPLYRRGLTNAEAKVLNSGDEAQGFFRIERATPAGGKDGRPPFTAKLRLTVGFVLNFLEKNLR